jgi:hypothetical protein
MTKYRGVKIILDNGKPTTGFARPGRFYGSVKGQEVCLCRNLVNIAFS